MLMPSLYVPYLIRTPLTARPSVPRLRRLALHNVLPDRGACVPHDPVACAPHRLTIINLVEILGMLVR